MEKTAILQAVIELIDSLSLEDQAGLVELLQKRVRHQALVSEIQEIRQEVAQGDVRFGTVVDFLGELEESGLDAIDEFEPKEQIFADLREAIRQGKAGETLPLSELWDGINSNPS